MNFRKNSVLIVGLAMAFVLFAAAIFFLVVNQNAYRQNQRTLDSARNRLEALNNRNPYPSEENVTLARQNLDLLIQQYNAVNDAIKREQLRHDAIEPARFAPMLEDAARRVYAKAKDGGVVISSDFGLGFKDYAAGKLPPSAPDIMSRLVLQLKTVEDLCLLGIDAKISSIDRIERDAFEMSAVAADSQADSQAVRGRGRSVQPAPGTRPGAGATVLLGLPPAPANSLYTTERFSIEFTGWESAVWEFINRIVSAKVMYVIVDINFQNLNAEAGKPVDLKNKLSALTAASKAAQASTAGTLLAPAPGPAVEPSVDSISHEDRIVGGREPIKARIVVDMYQFVDQITQPVAGEVQP